MSERSTWLDSVLALPEEVRSQLLATLQSGREWLDEGADVGTRLRMLDARNRLQPGPPLARNAPSAIRSELLRGAIGPEAQQRMWEDPIAQTATGFLGPMGAMGGLGFGGVMTYHGTPHTVPKYDLSKIGTGEGAQAYGHGMYFAENPEVAKSYKQTEGGYKRVTGGMTNKQEFVADHLSQGRPEMNILEMYAMKYGGSFDDAMKDLIEVKRMYGGGNLYKQDLPDEVLPNLLQWDKPFAEHPESVQKGVRAVIAKATNEAANGPHAMRGVVTDSKGATKYAFPDDPSNLDGAGLYEMLTRVYGNSAGNELRAAGIPGLSYLDQGSRALPGGNKWKVTIPGKGSSTFDFAPSLKALPEGSTVEPILGTKNHVIWDQTLLDRMIPQQMK